MLLLRHAVVVRWAIDDNDDGYTDQDTDDALLRDFRIKRPTRCLEGAKGRKARKQARKPVYCTVGLSAAFGPTHLVLVFGGWISMTCCVVPPIQYVGAWVRVCMRSLCSFLLTCMKVRQGIYGPGLRNQRGRRGAKSHQIWKSEVSLFFFLSLPLSFTVQGNISLHSKPHLRLLRSFRIYLEARGRSPWMSRCQFQSTLFHCTLERADPALRRTRFQNVSHSEKKKTLGSSRHPLVTNPKVPCVPKEGVQDWSRMMLECA